MNKIQLMVNECAAQGGGRVNIAAGEWKSGPIHLTGAEHAIVCEAVENLKMNDVEVTK